MSARSSLLVVAGFTAGVAATFAGFTLAGVAPAAVTPSDRAYVVSIDEVRQNFVFAEEFSDRYNRTVTMSDGSTREITLRPVVKDGRHLVELIDKSDGGTGRTYMGPNGTTTNGTLMVNVKDLALLRAAMQARIEARRAEPNP